MKVLLLTAIISVFTLSGINHSFAHDSTSNCCDPCPMCKLFKEDGLVEKSKEELTKIKENIEERLSKKNIKDLGKDAVASLQNCLTKINDELEKMKD